MYPDSFCLSGPYVTSDKSLQRAAIDEEARGKDRGYYAVHLVMVSRCICLSPSTKRTTSPLYGRQTIAL